MNEIYGRIEDSLGFVAGKMMDTLIIWISCLLIDNVFLDVNLIPRPAIVYDDLVFLSLVSS